MATEKGCFGRAAEPGAGEGLAAGRRLMQPGSEQNRNVKVGLWGLNGRAGEQGALRQAGGRQGGEADAGGAGWRTDCGAAAKRRKDEKGACGHTSTGDRARGRPWAVQNCGLRRHELSAGGTAGQRYAAKNPTRIMIPVAQFGQRCGGRLAGASASWRHRAGGGSSSASG